MADVDPQSDRLRILNALPMTTICKIFRTVAQIPQGHSRPRPKLVAYVMQAAPTNLWPMFEKAWREKFNISANLLPKKRKLGEREDTENMEPLPLHTKAPGALRRHHSFFRD